MYKATGTIEMKKIFFKSTFLTTSKNQRNLESFHGPLKEKAWKGEEIRMAVPMNLSFGSAFAATA